MPVPVEYEREQGLAPCSLSDRSGGFVVGEKIVQLNGSPVKGVAHDELELDVASAAAADDGDFFAKEETLWSVDDDKHETDGDAVLPDGPARWAVHFRHLLASLDGMALKTIHCDENAEFWTAASALKEVPEAEVEAACDSIIERFIRDNARRSINVKAFAATEPEVEFEPEIEVEAPAPVPKSKVSPWRRRRRRNRRRQARTPAQSSPLKPLPVYAAPSSVCDMFDMFCSHARGSCRAARDTDAH